MTLMIGSRKKSKKSLGKFFTFMLENLTNKTHFPAVNEKIWHLLSLFID